MVAIAFAVVGGAYRQEALAQESSTAPAAMQAGPAIAEPIAAKHEVPAIMVMGFESGTVSAQVSGKRGLMSMRGRMQYDGESYEPSQLGIGIADMLVEQLLATGQFRIIERNATAAGSSAQFIVTGSVTRFGFEERNVGGLLANVATMGMVGYKQHKTEVALTARVINAKTGEIVASMSADGASGKGGGLRVFGMGSNGLGGGDISSSNFRATAIGQATGRAVANLARKLVEQKSWF
jgi:curli biogenesis system outer membrane secretion channel CsgG